MSEKSNTETAEVLNEPESRRVEIYVDIKHANEILKSFEVPMPDAADLDEIRLFITR